MKTKKPYFVQFGPAIPIVPITDFTKIGLTKEQMNDLWTLCGPTVERNMQRRLELWQVIAMAYLEGLNHGYGVAQRIGERDGKEGKQDVRAIQESSTLSRGSSSPWEGL